MAFIIGAATLAVTAASAYASHQGQTASAKKQNAYAAATDAANREHRRDVMEYQMDVWQQDLAYANEVLAYSRGEFDKQTMWATTALAAVERNRDADAFTLAVRGIEETIAATFNKTSTAQQGQAARAQYANRERGVEGNSVETILGDVMRQEGDVVTVIDVNRNAVMRQMGREALALDAQHDAQASQIAGSIRTFAPTAPIREPGPVPVQNPTATVAAPSGMQLVAGLANSFAAGVNAYNGASGQNMQQTVGQVGSWVGRQFSIGGSGSSP
ncbi:hypothetical protein AAFN86_28735 [Roseomonas sp. CAU 1739]|uniref:hypothetical protein n=1 Tax=Roseomonas sp. CAU 1739 TaxID=3140364 RepID=UPI00325ADE48